MPAMVSNGDLLLDGCLTSGAPDARRALKGFRHRDDAEEEAEDCAVLGVLLSEDRRVCGQRSGSLVLGSVLVDEREVGRRRCHQLRQMLQAQFPALADNFVFLSKDGWPILKSQECSVRANKVINEQNAIEIQKYFESASWRGNADGGMLGLCLLRSDRHATASARCRRRPVKRKPSPTKRISTNGSQWLASNSSARKHFGHVRCHREQQHLHPAG